MLKCLLQQIYKTARVNIQQYIQHHLQYIFVTALDI